MQAAFGGVIAVILLGIYVHLIRVAYLVVDCVATSGCTRYSATYFNDGMAQTLSIVGGLVSALVIAELAVTKPGETPVARILAADASNLSKSVLRAVTVVYIITWIAAGLFAFFVGLYHPQELPPLTNLGQAWLGLAVASSYAYFGIKPT
jgi:ABC-type thiamin/hydroxymethylpyrimidine transport system permease subunit